MARYEGRITDEMLEEYAGVCLSCGTESGPLCDECLDELVGQAGEPGY